MRRTPRSTSSSPRSLIPVPASSTSTVPSSSEISTHDVLPPQITVVGPGEGTEPRQPQIFSCIRPPRYSRQKIVMIPTNSSAWAKSGNPVTEISRSMPSRS